MEPTLRAGEFLAVRAPRPGEPRAGQIVVATLGGREVVKRVERVDGDEVWLAGDNAAASSDSRTAGAAAHAHVIGIVFARYWPVVRARRL